MAEPEQRVHDLEIYATPTMATTLPHLGLTTPASIINTATLATLGEARNTAFYAYNFIQPFILVAPMGPDTTLKRVLERLSHVKT